MLRVRQFYAVSSDADSSPEGPVFADRERVFSTNHLDIPDFRTPPPAHTFVNHNCGRKKHNEEHALTVLGPTKPKGRLPLFSQLVSCRNSFSMGHLYDQFGLTEIHSAQELQTMPSISSTPHRTPEVEKWRSARDMFAKHSISRPSGWLSDVEDLSLSGDGNASPRRYCRFCHVCSTLTWAPTHCSSCGHRLCAKCVCEVPGSGEQAHANFSHHLSPVIARIGPQYVSPSRSHPDTTQTLHQGIATSHSTSKTQRKNHIDTVYDRSTNVSAESSWRTTNEDCREVKTSSGIAAQISKESSRTKQGQFDLVETRPTWSVKESPFLLKDKEDRDQATNQCVSSQSAERMECDDPMCRATHAGHFPFRHSISCSKTRSEHSERIPKLVSPPLESPEPEPSMKSGSDTTPPVGDDTVHRHHSAGFHSHHHIAEHLSSAVGHNAHDLLEGRNKKRFETVSSKASIEPIPYLKPLTQAQPVTQVDLFQWAQDTVPTGHPGRSNYQHSSATKVATNVSNHRSPNITNESTENQAVDTVWKEISLQSEPREVHSDTNLSWRNNDIPKLRLTDTPSWLKSPTKEAADATTRLRHINTKSHETLEHAHGYLSSIAVDSWKGRATTRSKNSIRAADARRDSNSLRYQAGSSQDANRVAAPSPPTALHVTQHQDTQSRLGLSPEHYTQAGSIHEAKS
ncbi:hypothetical protein F5Y19DRAFT_469936 [Xylariaceae sp. FL1651]|nr:hypothetical protein F5Y19DRAFT_469936 [Xylariaceae sp. FL1651]